jgi:hypothetical protein
MKSKLPKNFRIREIDAVVIIMILALVHGLLYVFLIPPWQHYDEPNHFENVWLTATREGLPEIGDFNPHLTYEVLESMIKYGFYDNLGFQPELGTPYDHKSIPGYSQLGGQPFYYLILSVPLRLTLNLDVTNQMYVLRLVSLVFYLCTVLIAWRLACEISPPQHPIRFLTPLTLALFPGYVDIMTSINNDVGAALVMSLSLWGSVRLIARGFSIFNFLLAAVPAALSVYTKSTAVVSVIILPIALLFTILRNEKQKYAWVMIFLGSLVLSLTILSWDEAALWYRSISQEEPIRMRNEKAILGEYVFTMSNQAEVSPKWTKPLFQPVPRNTGWEIKDKEVTFGFWAWASQPVEMRSPMIQMSSSRYYEDIFVQVEPQFFAFQAELIDPYPRIWVTVQPQISKKQGDIHIYFDNLTLVEGLYPVDNEPEYYSKFGDTGIWGGTQFANIIRNGSAERAGFRFAPLFDDVGSQFLGDNAYPSLALTSLMDWRGAGFMYERTITRMFRTFWAKFGWGNVEIIGAYPYTYLGFFTLFLCAGILMGVIRNWRKLPWNVLFLLFLSVLITFLAAFVRGAAYLPLRNIYLPVGRYLYPVMIPIALGVSFGWLELTRPFMEVLKKLMSYVKFFNLINLLSMSEWQAVVYLLLFIFLDIFALYSIIIFYKFS